MLVSTETYLTEATITKQAHKLFIKYGIRSVTMDDIALSCGISKRTLYQYFDRTALLSSLINKLLQKYEEAVKLYKKASGSAYEKLKIFLGMVGYYSSDFSASFLHDLKLHYLDLWQLMENFKKTTLIQLLETNLKQGVEENQYRQNIFLPAIGDMYCYMIESVMEQKVAGKFSSQFLISEINQHFMQSISIKTI